MFRWIRSEHKIRQKSWDPDLFRSGSVCGIWIWIRLKVLVLDLDLDPNGTCDPFGIWDPHGTQDLSCDLDPFETEPVICLGSGSEWTFVNPFVFWIRLDYVIGNVQSKVSSSKSRMSLDSFKNSFVFLEPSSIIRNNFGL